MTTVSSPAQTSSADVPATLKAQYGLQAEATMKR